MPQISQTALWVQVGKWVFVVVPPPDGGATVGSAIMTAPPEARRWEAVML